MRLYRLEKHFDTWILQEGFVVFEPGIRYFNQLPSDEGNRVNEEVNITNLYDGAYIYFDESCDYHLIDDVPLKKAYKASLSALNTDDVRLQEMAISLLDHYLSNPKIIPKNKEQEYVETKKE